MHAHSSSCSIKIAPTRRSSAGTFGQISTPSCRPSLTVRTGTRIIPTRLGRFAELTSAALLHDTGCWASSMECHIRWLSIKPDNFPSGPSQLIEIYVS